jgi:hypothetical protein
MTTPLINRKQRAMKNIKLLEMADNIAISNLSKKKLKPEYRKVLTNQEDQLKYYLDAYKTHQELPVRITTEYEYPIYFYYEVNSKKYGKIQKRTRLDSKLFKKFMQNNVKRELARSQGIPIEKMIRQKKEAVRMHDFDVHKLFGVQYPRGKHPSSLANLKQYR